MYKRNLPILLLLFCLFISQSGVSQDTLTYEHLQMKNIRELFKNKQQFKVYQLKNNSFIKLGDTLLVGNPSTTNTTTGTLPGSSYKMNMNVYSTIIAGDYNKILLTGIYFAGINLKGTKLVVDEIQLQMVKLNKDFFAGTIIITRVAGTNKMSYSIMDIDTSVETGEIIILNAPLTKNAALEKLKKSKELYDLELISKDEYEALKKELAPIIMSE